MRICRIMSPVGQGCLVMVLSSTLQLLQPEDEQNLQKMSDSNKGSWSLKATNCSVPDLQIAAASSHSLQNEDDTVVLLTNKHT